MPLLKSDLSVNVYRQVNELPSAAIDALKLHARNANVILPTVTKALQGLQQTRNPQSDQAWIVCNSKEGVEFILSVTEGPMGAYPVFIVTTLPFHLLTADHIGPCIQLLVHALKKSVPRRRVYSVFAVEPVTLLFVEEWTHVTGIKAEAKPYYAAKMSYCTLQTLDTETTTDDPALGYVLRPGTPGDINTIAKLCYEFAASSVSSLSYILILHNTDTPSLGTVYLDREKGERRSGTPCTQQPGLGPYRTQARTRTRGGDCVYCGLHPEQRDHRYNLEGCDQ
jgi:hypothetical protein